MKKIWSRIKDAWFGIVGVILVGGMVIKTQFGNPVDITQHGPLKVGYKICVTGDTGTGDKNQKKVAGWLENEGCDELRILGDLIYRNGLKNENDKQFKEKFLKPYNYFIKNNTPISVVLGNHDYRRNVGAWIKLANKHPVLKFPYYYYAEKYGTDLCIISLNSTSFTTINYNKHAKEQAEWIKNLDFNDCKFTMSLAHHPYLSAGNHGDAGSEANSKRMKKFYEKHIVGQFDTILGGHDHNLSYDGDVKGTHNFVTGAGGKVRDIKNKRIYAESTLGYLVIIYKGNNKFDFKFKNGTGVRFSITLSGKGLRKEI